MKRLTVLIISVSLAAFLAGSGVIAAAADAAAAPGLDAMASAPAAAPVQLKEKQPAGLAVRCGKLITMDKNDTVINGAVVLIRDGKFEAVGPEEDVAVPEGYRVIDGSSRWVVPGLVDFHSHVGGDLSDLNDGVYLTNPDLRTIETLTPENEYVQDARAGGITSMLLIPGSGNNMAGFGTLIKSAGRTTDDIVLREPGVIKISQAGNPERYWYGVGRSYMYWNLRTTLEEIKAYHEAWCSYENGEAKEPPERDPVKEKFRGLFRHEYGALVHTQGYQLMMNTALQLWDTIGIWLVMGHATFDGYKTAPLMAERNIPVVAGPRNLWLDRHDRRINGVPAKYNEGGVEILGTNTDAPVLPIEEHFFQATLGVRLGWDDPYAALKGLTWVGARAGLIDHRVGSIEQGKDADMALYKGDPIDPRSPCVLTIVNGEVVYDAAKDGQRY